MENREITIDEKVKAISHLDELTLKDTIELMNSEDYKLRFVAEYIQLKIRYNKLHRMIVKYNAGTLEFTPTCDISILDDQAYYMGNYLRMLEIRAEIEKIPLPRI